MTKRSKKIAAPYLVWMIAFTALPLLLVIYFAFTDKSGSPTLDNLTGLGNYVSVFFMSLFMAIIATAICLVIAYPISFMLSRLRSGRQGIALMLVMLPMWMNFLLRTYAWMSLLERNGLINKFLGLFGIGPFEMINTAGAVVLGMVYNYLPYMILPLYTAMLKIDNSIIEAAEDLGAGTWQKLTKVLIPLSMPGIQTGITMVFVPSISTFIISKMLGGGNFWLIGDLIESQFLGNAYNYNLGSAMSLVLMVVVLLCMSLTGGFDSEDIEGVISVVGKILKRVYVVFLFGFLYVPIAVMIAFSFNQSKSRTVWAGFTLDWYVQLFRNEAVLSALLLSVVLAFASALLATVLGTMAAVGINRMRRGPRALAMNLSYIPIVNPEIITGVSMMLLFVVMKGVLAWLGADFLANSLMGIPSLLIAHITFNVPYVLFNVSPKLRQMDKNLYDAALDLGCNERQAFFKVVLPEIMPAVFSSFLICLTYSIDDFTISYFTAGNMQTLPIAIYAMTRRKVSPEINALSAIMFVAILAIILVANYRESAADRKKRRRVIAR